MNRSRRARATVVAAGGLALLVPAAATAATAPATVTHGTTTVRPSGAAYRTLKRADVQVLPIGAAARKGSRIAIPVTGGTAGTVSQLTHGATDGLLLRGGSRRVRLTDLRIRVGRSASRVTGRVDGRALTTLFTLSTKSLDVRLAQRAASRKNVSWRLTARTARTLRSRLGVRGLKAGTLGVATLTAKLAAPAAPPAPVAPVAPVVGNVAGGTADWGVRTSFRNYINGFAHGKIELSDGAEVTPGTTGDATTYRFATPSGSADPATGVLSVGFRGTLYFEGHGSGEAAALRVWIRNPRVVIAAAGATVGTLHADVTSKDLNSGRLVDYPDVDLASLDLTRGTRTATASGITWTNVPAALSEAGVPAFAGFYPTGAELDPVSFAVTTG